MENRHPLFEIMKYLPASVRDVITGYILTNRADADRVEEIRLRRNAPLSLTVSRKNVLPGGAAPHICTSEEMFAAVRLLCEDSLHSFEETLKDGYLTVSGGYRVGVCGVVSGNGERISGAFAVNSLCIRIPHLYRGISGGLRALLVREKLYSALVYSPPGVGKTTLLRDFAVSVSAGESPFRVAVIDTRGELYDADEYRYSLCDALIGYPRAKGIEIATRTMSPELIVCDEIGSDEETRAILSAQNAGVPLLASAHGESADSIMRRPNVRLLCEKRVFDYLIGVGREADGGFSLFPEETAALL